MGTRSLTHMEDNEGKTLITMYRQYDGYPEGHGLELAKFLAPFTVVNGYGVGAKLGEIANGIGCLAAQLVAHFKEDVGGIYLYPPNTTGMGEEYIYIVTPTEIYVHEIYYGDTPKKLLYSGSWDDFLTWCEEQGD